MLQTTEETELTMPSDFRWHSFLVSAGYLPDTLEIIKLMKIDSNNINQIAKVANSCGTVDGKTISDMKENHERVLKKVEKTFNKYLDIY